jgi:hypothetical protein
MIRCLDKCSHNYILCEYDYLNGCPMLMLHRAIKQLPRVGGACIQVFLVQDRCNIKGQQVIIPSAPSPH